MARNTYLKPIFLVIGIFAFIFFLMTLGDSWGVTWSGINPTIIKLLPWLVIFGVSLFALTRVMSVSKRSYGNYEIAAIPLITGTIGIIFSMILKTLYDEGHIIDEFITGSITITDLITVIIVLFFIIGIIMAAMRR